MDAVWDIATTAGLDADESAVVSQLTWLRMAERWPTVRALARTQDSTLHPVEQPTTQVEEWILHTARSEVDAWVRDEQRRHRESVFTDGSVVRMAPGFRPADPTGSEAPVTPGIQPADLRGSSR